MIQIRSSHIHRLIWSSDCIHYRFEIDQVSIILVSSVKIKYNGRKSQNDDLVVNSFFHISFFTLNLGTNIHYFIFSYYF